MSRDDNLREKILSGRSDANIRFEDLRSFLLRLGFAERTRGSHCMFRREGVRELINLQRRREPGEALPGTAGPSGNPEKPPVRKPDA